LLALWAIELLAPLGSDAIRSAGVDVDGTVLAFGIAVAVLSGLLSGLVPAWQATRPDVAAQFKDASRRSTAAGRRRVRDALVVAEVAIALILLLAAGNDFLAFRRLLSIDPGFQAPGAVAMELSLPPARFADPAQQGKFFQELLRRIPGAGYVLQTPLGGTQSVWHFDVEGPGGRGSGHVVEQLQVMSAQAPAALGVPVLAGRAFNADEPLRVALVNQAFAQRYWPGENPVGHRVRPYRYHFEDASGRRFWPLDEPQWFTVVGVLGDVRAVKLSLAPRPEVILPLQQFPLPEGAVIARGQSEQALRAALAGLDPDIAPQRVAPLMDIVAQSAEQRRDPMILLSVLAALALLMAGIGLYAAMSWEVAERGRELSIRMALGADSVRVLRLLLTEGLLLAALGIALGAGAAFLLRQPLGLARVETSLLLALPAAIFAMAFVACWLPARRASRIDPRVAFRLD
jgi:putative ABC transport system permease protein